MRAVRGRTARRGPRPTVISQIVFDPCFPSTGPGTVYQPGESNVILYRPGLIRRFVHRNQPPERTPCRSESVLAVGKIGRRGPSRLRETWRPLTRPAEGAARCSTRPGRERRRPGGMRRFSPRRQSSHSEGRQAGRASAAGLIRRGCLVGHLPHFRLPHQSPTITPKPRAQGGRALCPALSTERRASDRRHARMMAPSQSGPRGTAQSNPTTDPKTAAGPRFTGLTKGAAQPARAQPARWKGLTPHRSYRSPLGVVNLMPLGEPHGARFTPRFTASSDVTPRGYAAGVNFVNLSGGPAIFLAIATLGG
jgi:hypothetical protein